MSDTQDSPAASAGLPTDAEFTASNGIKVATDARGAVGVQWGSPRTGGWTFHDPDETLALQEFYFRHAAGAVDTGPWQVYPVDEDGDTYVQLIYSNGLLYGGYAGEFHPDELDALIAQLIAVRATLPEFEAAHVAPSP